MKKIISLIAVVLIVVCALTACGGNKEAVSTDGSTSMNKVIGALGEAFETDTGITVTYNATGSGAGIQAVQEGRCDIGLASRNLKDEEKANGLEETILAYDGIAIIVSSHRSVGVLTHSQVTSFSHLMARQFLQVLVATTPISRPSLSSSTCDK